VEILVTGGNGLLGQHLVSALQQRGDVVRVLALPAEDTSWLEDRGIAVHRGDIRRPDTLVRPMRGVEGVFHLAAMIGMWRSNQDYHAVNVTGTRNVCEAALAAAVRRFVHVSSSSVYGIALGRVADESFPLAPFRDPYPITKAAADALVQRMMAEDGLPAVIVRPDLFFGPGDHMHFARFADRMRSGRWVIIGRGDNALPLVYVTDVVQGLLLALDHERAVGEAYNITNDCALTQRQFMNAIAREIGASPPRIRIPYRALYAVGWAGECLATATGSWLRPPTTRYGVAFLGTESRCAITKAQRDLGYTPRVPLDTGVRHAAAWYLRDGGRRQRSRSALSFAGAEAAM
jgi:nucleoside-diphosphate-sugar epimerase